MKRKLLTLMMVGLVFTINAQQPAKLGNPLKTAKAKPLLKLDEGILNTNIPAVQSRIAAKQKTLGSRAVTSIPIGSAGNLYTIIAGESNMIAASNALNSVYFVHRCNANTGCAGTFKYMYDLSKDGGNSFAIDQGPLNPAIGDATAFCGRYPQAVLHNPTGNTNPDNAYAVYLGTYHNCAATADWNGYIAGVGKLDGTGATNTDLNTIANGDVLIAKSLTNGKPGEFWTIDFLYNNTSIYGFVLVKGTFNTGTNDVDWVEYKQFLPSFALDGSGNPIATSPVMAFDPTGTYGYIAFLGDMDNVQAGVYAPIIFKTSDGGVTWTDETTLTYIDLTTLCPIMGMMSPNGSGVPTTAFNMDMTVDVNGNPHLFAVIGSGTNFSIQSALEMGMFDITSPDKGTTWEANYLGRVWTLRGTFSGLTEDNRPQASRTEDGSKLFISWLDSDTTNNPGLDNQFPNTIVCGIDVASKMATAPMNFTAGDLLWDGNALFSTASPTVLGTTGTYTIPTVVAEIIDTSINPCFFHYFTDVTIADADFTVDLSVSNAALSANAKPIAGFEAVCVNDTTFFIDQSLRVPSQWWWDFGDGTVDSVSSPQHSFADGTYNVSLIATSSCGSDTFTKTVVYPGLSGDFTADSTVVYVNSTIQFTSNIPGATNWFWNFGDGITDTTQNPMYAYPARGTYTVTHWAWNDSTCELYIQKTGYIQVLDPTAIAELTANPFNASIFPNPSANGFNIKYTLPDNHSNVKVSVFNAIGAGVAELVNERQSQGEHAITWKPVTASSSGTYFCVLDINGTKTVMSMALAK